MRSFLVVTEAGLMVHHSDDTPLLASDRDFAVEPSGVMKRVCAWCKTGLGVKACEPSQHGETSHGICRTCSDKLISSPLTVSQ